MIEPIYEDVPLGWHGLLDVLIRDLEDLDLNYAYVLWQSRVFNGRWWIDVDTRSTMVKQRVRDAELESARTCQRCGDPGVLSRLFPRTWQTPCTECAAATGYVMVPDAPDMSAVIRRLPYGDGVNVAPGWYWIVARLNEQLAQLDPRYEIWETKERYGELRFYVSPRVQLENPSFRTLIRAAEDESTRTCEWCAAPGEWTERHGWARVLCEQCAAGLPDA